MPVHKRILYVHVLKKTWSFLEYVYWKKTVGIHVHIHINMCTYICLYICVFCMHMYSGNFCMHMYSRKQENNY